MQTRRGTVLGKRGHSDDSNSLVACDQLPTPDCSPNPKRPRTSLTLLDDASNKENIPPLKSFGDITPRRARALRRSVTDDFTTTSTRLGIQRSTSVSSLQPSTPIREIATLAISTPPPTPPTVLVPLHVRIRALLRSTCNNTQICISGRDDERASILNFLASFVDGASMSHDKIMSNMFISGSPGTGKTALVNSLIRTLSTDYPADFRVISINCMALKTLDALWERILEELADPSKKRPAAKKLKGRDAVKSAFDTLKIKCILILDELDHIAPNEQSLSSIFTLTDALRPTLRLIGIANTHTLTSSSSNAFLSSTNNVETVHFAPYTPIQLQEILQSRLASLSNVDSPNVVDAATIKKLLPNPAIVLLTKKIAAVTGDVRCLFEVLRGAIDMAVEAARRQANDNPLNSPLPTVTPQYVLAAFKAYTPSSALPVKKSNVAMATSSASSASNNEASSKISNLGLQARLVLLALILASKRLQAGLPLGTSRPASPRKPSPIKRSFSMPNPSTMMTSFNNVRIDTSGLHAYYSSVLARTGDSIFEPVSRSEFSDLLGILEGVGLVSLSSSSISTGTPKGKRTFGRSTLFGAGIMKNGVGEVRLVEGVWGEEVLRCLGVSGENTLVDPREEEVRGIWEREKSRLSKDMKAVTCAAAAAAGIEDVDVLAGAFQL